MNRSESRTMWRRLLIVAGVLVAVAALAFAACAAPSVVPEEAEATAEADPPGEAENQETSDTADPDPAAAGEEVEANPADFFAVTEEPTEEYNGIPVGITESGLPYRGDPDAPVIMVEYSDYQCPFCGRHFVQTEPALTEKYVRDGQVRAVFVEFPLEQLHPYAPMAHAAALCVLEQGSAQNYWNIHGELFRSAEEWGAVPDGSEIFARLADESGADVEAFTECMEGGEQLAAVQELVNFSMEQGFGGTPSFQLIRVEDGVVAPLVGAQPFEQFEAQIDLLLAGGMPETEAQQSGGEAEIPFWATEEGWAPDPERPGYNMAGDQYKGSLDAPIKIIEFSDFQCPFCKRHVEQTQPILDEAYVETGQVMWMFKHFPLDIHPQAPAAGAAAECAAEQGKFWEMAELIFENQEEWSVADPVPVLTDIASELELDMDAFALCLEDDEIAERVTSDLMAGAAFVRGTPSFIVLVDGEGSIIPGALPADSFVQILDEMLAGGEAE